MNLDKKIKASLYYPFVHCSITRNCWFVKKAKEDILIKQERCFMHCLNKEIICDLGCKTLVFIKGNVQYYINKEKPLKLRDWNIDRLIYMPKFPNQNSFSDKESYLDWNYEYEKVKKMGWGEKPDKELSQIINSIKLPEGANILDVGCGKGRHYHIFRKNINYFGLDISQKAINIAKKNITNGIFFCEDIINFNKFNNFFDMVIDYGCFHCLSPFQREDYFDVIYNSLKKNSYAILFIRKGSSKLIPIYYVSDQLPEWELSKSDIVKLLRGKFCVHEFKDKLEGANEKLFYVILKKI